MKAEWTNKDSLEMPETTNAIPISYIKAVRDKWYDYGKGAYPYSADVLNHLIELWEKQNEETDNS